MNKSSCGVGVSSLVDPIHVFNVVFEHMAGDVDGFGSDDNDLLSLKDVLCNNRCESSKEVTFSVYDDLLLKHINNNVFQ